MNSSTNTSSQELRHWQRRIFASVWITYFAFYLCRYNMPLAKKPLCEAYGWDERGIGIIFTALTAMYAIGQFVNGQLADRFGTRLIATLGIAVSVAMNLAVFAVTMFASPETSNPDHVLLWLTLFWGVNGFFQAMGWSPMVRAMTHWFETERRGRVMGMLGTCYQFGAAFSWFLAFYLTGYFVREWGTDWRAVFWVPAAIFAAVGVYFFWAIRNKPEDVGLPTVNVEKEQADRSQDVEHPSLVTNVLRTLSNPYIWVVALAFFMLDVNRYGFVNWLPSFLDDAEGGEFAVSLLGNFKNVMKRCIHPLAGALGCVVAGWATDKFFGGRRAPVIALLLLMLGLLSIIFPFLDVHNTWLIVTIVAMIGFCTYGPHILMVGHAAQDFGHKSGSAGAAGFIDGVGYIGASLAGIGAAEMIVAWGYRWTFITFGIAAIFGAGFATIIWKVKPTTTG